LTPDKVQPGLSSSTLSSIAAGMLFTRQSTIQKKEKEKEKKALLQWEGYLSKPY